MEGKRPPDVDAEFRVVHGAWPRWALQLGLLKLALSAAGVVALMLLAAGLVAAWISLRS